MKSIFLRSIRFKITVLYTAILAITLASFSAVLYHNVKRSLHGNMDTLLMSKAEGIAEAVNTYWEVSALEENSTDGAAKPETFKKRRNVNFAIVAQRWVKQRSDDPKLLDIIVHVFDTDGHTIASSKKPQDLTEIPRRNFIAVLQGKKRFDTVGGSATRPGIALRIFTTPVFENEKVAYIVQVASPLSSIETAVAKLRVALFILFPVTVFLTGIMGAVLAKVTLNPVDKMIHTINKITAENMQLRLELPGTSDEIEKLAETFNTMLDSLERSFSSQKQLFEDLSHELKTPLTILKGEFEVALKKVRSPEDYEKVLRSALEEINKLSKLAEDLLVLARFDSEQAPPEKHRLDLNELLYAVAENVKGLADLKKITLSYTKNTGDFLLDGDKTQLRTLFLNILDNAIKYTPKSGMVAIFAKRAGTLVKVAISDTGIGIPSSQIPHIFDRFYRVDKARSNHNGFGLGLSIARSIARAHHGNIEVEKSLSQGTTFIISLPLSIH